MQRAILVLGLAVVLGCAGCGPDPAPRMPDFKTEQGKANARACLQTYNSCTPLCYAMRSNSCIHRCNEALASCYAASE
jgi:hypothetical protein